MSFWQVVGILALASLIFELSLILRRGVKQQLGYFALVGAAMIYLGWVVQGLRPSGRPSVELVAGLIATALLVVLPSVLDRMVRRAFSEEKYDRAARLAGLREILVPGAISAAEREYFERIAAARSGRVDEVVRELRRHLVEAEPPFDQQIQEQIVTVLLFGRRWREAATQFETHLGDDPSRHPPLAVHMVRAYGALGELERAAQLLHRLEERLHPGDPASQTVLLQARLHLLAFAGSLAEVERLLAHPALKAMPPRMRSALLDTARERASAATADATTSASAAAPVTPLIPVDRHLALFLESVAVRAASDLRTRPAAPTRALPPATMTLIAVNACAYLLVYMLLGDSVSGDHPLRAGASFHPAVRAGEWWRLWTAMFLHGGVDHLLLNLYGLFVLGRVVEPVLGTARFLCVYAVAGLAGNLASVYNPSAESAFSLGASGAVLGVMAALMVMLVLRRGVWPEGWRREVLVNLGVLLVIQLAIGAWWRVIDNYAHVGGLLGGAAAAMLLAPGGLLGRGKLARLVVLSLLAVLGVSAGRALAALVREDISETLARVPRVRLRVGPVSLSVPAGSELVREEGDSPGDAETYAMHPLGIGIESRLVPPPATVEEALAEAVRRDVEQAQRTEHELNVESLSPLPVAGWASRAQTLSTARGGAHRIYFARPAPPAVLLVIFQYQGNPRSGGGPFDDEVTSVLTSAEVDEAALKSLPVTAVPAAPAPTSPDAATAPPGPPASAPR